MPNWYQRARKQVGGQTRYRSVVAVDIFVPSGLEEEMEAQTAQNVLRTVLNKAEEIPSTLPTLNSNIRFIPGPVSRFPV